MAQDDRFADLLSQVAREVTRRQNSEVCCGNLTLEQFQTLQAIDRSERSSIGSLSAELQVDISTMSRNISVLERGGYLARVRSEEDSRVVHVRLVAKGRRALKTLQCSERDVLKDVYGRLPALERVQAVRTLESLRDCLTKEGIGEHGVLSTGGRAHEHVVSAPAAPARAETTAMPHRVPTLGRRVVAEAVGTALLLATVVGSGIMAERLAGGNVAVALLANTIATGGGLVALILTFGGISGAHFNPVVTVADASQRGLSWRDVAPYVVAQMVGAFFGVALAHVMFGEPLFSASRHVRAGFGQLTSEFTATFGLLSVIWGCSRSRPAATPFAVAAYITAAYWFTASTSFANPAVTLARAASDTFAGIRPSDAPGFIAAQVLGAASATLLFRWLAPNLPAVADRVLSPTNEEDAA